MRARRSALLSTAILLAAACGTAVKPGNFDDDFGGTKFPDHGWLISGPAPIFAGIEGPQQVWMSHRDTVDGVPPGFRSLGQTATCEIAAMADDSRRLYSVQFHPEVVHTPRGNDMLANFLFGVCGCERDWNPMGQIEALERQIRDRLGRPLVLSSGRPIDPVFSGRSV